MTWAPFLGWRNPEQQTFICQSRASWVKGRSKISSTGLMKESIRNESPFGQLGLNFFCQKIYHRKLTGQWKKKLATISRCISCTYIYIYRDFSVAMVMTVEVFPFELVIGSMESVNFFPPPPFHNLEKNTIGWWFWILGRHFVSQLSQVFSWRGDFFFYMVYWPIC